MNTTEYQHFILEFFVDRDVKVSQNVLRLFRSPKFLNRTQLATLPDELLKRNLTQLLTEIFEEHDQRRLDRPGPIALLRPDVEPILLRWLCKLPPICGRSSE